MKKHDREFQPKDLVIPIWKAVLAVAIYGLVVLMLWLLNLIVHSELLQTTVLMLFRFLALVFFLAVISSYGEHFRRIQTVSLLVPALTALSSSIIIYFLATLFREMNKHLFIEFIGTICTLMLDNILVIFVVILSLSYLFYFVKRSA